MTGGEVLREGLHNVGDPNHESPQIRDGDGDLDSAVLTINVDDISVVASDDDALVNEDGLPGIGSNAGSDSEVFDGLKVGDRLQILANHSCLTAAQHSHFNVVENGQIVDRWEIHRGW